MTPERINELRDIALRHVDFSDSAGINVDTIVPCRELLDLLATAEREAVLREVLWLIRGGLSEWRRLDIICPALAEDTRSKIDAALETKGGE